MTKIVEVTEEQLAQLISLGISVNDDSLEVDIKTQICKQLEAHDAHDMMETTLTDMLEILVSLVEMDGPKPVISELKKIEVAPKLKNPEPIYDGNGNQIQEVLSSVPKKEKVKVEKVAKVAKDKTQPSTPKVKQDRVVYSGKDSTHVDIMKEFLKPLFDLGLDCNYGNSCISVALGTSDSKRSIICVESIIFLSGKIQCKVVFNGMNLFSKTENLTDLMSTHLDPIFVNRLDVKENRYPFVKAVEESEFNQLLSADLFNMMIEKIKGFDKKLRTNRKKMEDAFEGVDQK